MPRDPQNFIFVGVKNSVVALDDKTGTEMWRAKLRSSDFVSVLWDGEALIAANSGEVWRLDPRTGAMLWHNQLKGLGRGLISLASTRLPMSQSDADLLNEKRRRDQAAVAGVTAAAT